MQTIPITDIIVPADRQRQAFDEDKLFSLAESILMVGLLQPIVLREDGKTLVAGERRLRAINTYIYPLGKLLTHNGKLVEHGLIPFTKVGDLGALNLEEAELAENARREDLTWQELAAVQARLHKLRTAQAAADTFAEPWSVADTAKEIHGRTDGWYQDSVRQNVILADHLDNPDVAKAKTSKEAMKILMKQEEGRRHSALAAKVGATYSAQVHEAYNANCLDWMLVRGEQIERGTAPGFDVILTDPPYGMGAHEFGDAAGKLTGTEHHYDDSWGSFALLMSGINQLSGKQEHPGWCKLAYDVCKPQAHCYAFCDFDNFHDLKKWMQAAGWYVFRTPLINVKESGRVPLPDQGPRRQYEICLYAIKGGKHTTGIYSDVVHSSADEQMGHGAQKPVSLYTNLLQRSTRPGDLVLDSFSGSGTIFPAATQCKVKAVGLELNPESYGMGVRRLQELVAAESAQGELING